MSVNGSKNAPVRLWKLYTIKNDNNGDTIYKKSVAT